MDLESLQLAYPPRVTPEFVLKNGWCPPPESKPDLPFQVCPMLGMDYSMRCPPLRENVALCCRSSAFHAHGSLAGAARIYLLIKSDYGVEETAGVFVVAFGLIPSLVLNSPRSDVLLALLVLGAAVALGLGPTLLASCCCRLLLCPTHNRTFRQSAWNPVSS